MQSQIINCTNVKFLCTDRMFYLKYKGAIVCSACRIIDIPFHAYDTELRYF